MKNRWLRWLPAALLLNSSAFAQTSQPGISALNPPSAVAGRSFTMQVTGGPFCPGSTVIFNNITLIPTNASSSLMTVAVDGQLTAQLSGTVPVRASNVTASACNFQGGISDPFNFTVIPLLSLDTTSLPVGGVGLNYSAQLLASGGSSPYHFNASQLPAGLALNMQTGLITGIPTQVGSTTSTIVVSDTTNQVVEQNLTFTITTAPTITTPTLPAGIVNSAYTPTALAASAGTAPYTWTLIGGNVPGLVIAPSTGIVSGTPTQAGQYDNFQIRVTDANGLRGTRIYSVVISNNTLQITTSTLPNGTVGVAYPSTTLAATGGTSPLTWSLVSGGPPGLSLSSSGVLSGTPTQAGAFNNVVISVAGASGPAVTRSFSVNIASPSLQITTSSLPDATKGVAYNATLSASGGGASRTWQTSSPLPSGITLSSGGVLSGTTQQLGAFSINVSVTDGSQTANRSLTLTVNDAPQTCIPFPSGFVPFSSVAYVSAPNSSGDRLVVGTLQSLGFSGIAGIPAPSFSNQKFCDPAVQLGPSAANVYQNVYVPTPAERAGQFTEFGALLVDPSTNSPFPGGIIPTNRLGSVYAWRVGAQPPASPVNITTTTLPQTTTFVTYQTALTASGGVQPYIWSAPAGLPPGLSLDANSGLLSGALSTEGVFSLNVQVRDAAGQTNTRVLQLIVGTPMTITTASIRNGQVGVPYEDFFSVTGGVGPYTWASFGTPPPGLFVNAIGTITGTPTFAGTFNLSVRVIDSRGQTATRSYSITITPLFRILTETIPPATLGTFYEQTFLSSGGTAPISWQLAGTPPAGLVLSNFSGTLSGFPTQSGSFVFGIVAVDSMGSQTSKSFTLTVNQGLRIAPENLPNGATNVAYTQNFSVTGGTPPYIYQIAGAVPGLALDPSTGAFRGTPAQSGTFNFTIRVNDSLGSLGTKAYTLIVVSNLQITTTSLSDALERAAYSQTLAASGGTPPYTWRITQGSLPEGLALNAASGAISGIPVRAGSSTITIEAADAAAQTASRSFTFAVLPGVAIQTAGTLASGTIGVPYSVTLAASGGTPPYSWRVRAGSLPDGTQLSPTGLISGTPTQSGRFTATIEVTDGASGTAAEEIFITINPPLLRFTSSEQLPDATAGIDYQFTPTVDGGTPPYRFALNGAPSELNMDGDTGRLFGRLASAGPLEFSIRVTDSNQVIATQIVTLRSGLPSSPSVNITGLPGSSVAGQQVTPRVAIAQPYPLPLNGELNLTFEPAVIVDDPAIQFASGGRRVVFNIPAGQTDAAFNAVSPGIQTGTVAGTIRVTPRVTALGTDVTPNPVPVSSITIARQAPTISSARINRTTAGFELVVTAYATNREITSAAVRLQTTGTVQGTDFTVNLASITAPFYQSAASNQFGSLCTITIPFTIQQGTTGSVTSASVTLTNSIGTSSSATANF